MFCDLDWPLKASRGFVSMSWASCYVKRRQYHENTAVLMISRYREVPRSIVTPTIPVSWEFCTAMHDSIVSIANHYIRYVRKTSSQPRGVVRWLQPLGLTGNFTRVTEWYHFDDLDWPKPAFQGHAAESNSRQLAMCYLPYTVFYYGVLPHISLLQMQPKSYKTRQYR